MIRNSAWSSLALFALSFTAQAADPNDIQLIVKYKQPAKSMVSMQSFLKQQSGMDVSDVSAMAGGAYRVHMRLSKDARAVRSLADETELVLKRLRKNPNVVYAVEDRKGHFKPLPKPESAPFENILSHDSQWDEFAPPGGIQLESAPGLKDGAWAYTKGQAATPVVVAVLDTGVEMNEGLVDSLLKDEEGNVWGWNFAGNNSDIHDETASYHGSHVSGTIAGYGQVMNGVGEHLKLLTVKIPDASGMFYESAVINGIYWAVGGDVPGVPANPYPAKVLNMSFGVDAHPGKEIDHCDEALQDAIAFARKKGAVIVVAAGNDNRWEHYNAPAVCNGTVKVASTGPEGLRSYFSNYGPGVTLAAPGGDLRYGTKGGILSTVKPGKGFHGSGYDFYQGTSMASPHVAGVVGLIQAVSQDKLSAQTIEQILYTTTHDFGQSADENKSCVGKKPCGHGILDAENAVKAVLAGYAQFFSAPVVKGNGFAACQKGMLKPAQNKLHQDGRTWIVRGAACQAEENYAHPQLEKTEKGQIVAHYGAVQLLLDQSTYKQCDLIGYDGVGCF